MMSMGWKEEGIYRIGIQGLDINININEYYPHPPKLQNLQQT